MASVEYKAGTPFPGHLGRTKGGDMGKSAFGIGCQSVALITAVSLALPPSLVISAHGAQPETAPATVSASPAEPSDGGWPRFYTFAGGGNAVIYQPQIVSWEDQRHLVAWAAVSYEER